MKALANSTEAQRPVFSNLSLSPNHVNTGQNFKISVTVTIDRYWENGLGVPLFPLIIPEDSGKIFGKTE